MVLCGYKYSFHHIEGISQVLPMSIATSNSKKMFQQFLSAVNPSNSSSSESEEEVDSNITFSEKLQNIIDKCNETEKCSKTEWNQHFAKELSYFDWTKERTNNIFKFYEALKPVPPITSVRVQAERAFSADGLFITKLHSRLNDKSINALYLLRSHFSY